MNSNIKEKTAYIAIMALYGTTGIMKRFIPFSSNFVSFSRALIATVFLASFMLITRKKLDFKAVKKNLFYLIIIGIFLGFNWVTFFEACTYTTVAKATLCYYMAPVIVILLSPIIYKEKLGLRKIICVLVAIVGMALVSGVLTEKDAGNLKGVIIGLIAASLYAAVIIMSRKVTDISSIDKTVIQLFVATLTLLPVIIFSKGFDLPYASSSQWTILLLIGILNTGLAYLVYFSTMPKIKAQTVAIFAYIDPVVSVLLSAVLLKEPLGIWGAIGAVMIIGTMIISEL